MARLEVRMLTTTNLHKTYRKAADRVHVLRGVDLDVHAGEFLGIVGPSGCGKTTLLHLLGTLDRPDEGRIRLDGERIDNLSSRRRDALRNRTFGFIFQFYHLLPELNTLENVMLPPMIEHSLFGWLGRRRQLRQQAAELLERVGLGHRLRHRPSELSGGEMQRTAIARALMNRPRVLLADEPTGNLDEATGKEIVRLLRELNRQDGLTIVMVTHNLEIVAATDRVVRLMSGRVQDAAEEAVAASESRSPFQFPLGDPLRKACG
jgi:lipoprotein-releasing system ATP-binding protein